MSFRMLKALSRRQLPAMVSDHRELAAIQTLHEAGLIKATFFSGREDSARGGSRETAVVATITALGWMMIQSFSSEEPPSGPDCAHAQSQHAARAEMSC